MAFVQKLKTHKHLLINIGIAVVFFAGGYFTRFFTAGGTAPSGTFPGNGAMTRGSGDMSTMGQGGGTAGSANSRGATTGTIVSNSGSYITVKLSTGSTKNVYINDSTTIYSRTKITADQLTVNKTVTVQGETNSDNSMTGTTVTVE